MRPTPETARRAAALARLAARRHGIVTREQLLALGYSNAAIDRLVKAGRLHRLYVGVFAVGHTVLTVEGRLLAAVLAAGPGAVLSHDSAADLWEMRMCGSGRIHVTVPAASGRRPGGAVAIHRTRRSWRRSTRTETAPAARSRARRRADADALAARGRAARAVQRIRDPAPAHQRHRRRL